jgi:hypothetical protein
MDKCIPKLASMYVCARVSSMVAHALRCEKISVLWRVLLVESRYCIYTYTNLMEGP